MNISMAAVIYSGLVMFGIPFVGGLCIGASGMVSRSSDINSAIFLVLVVTYVGVAAGAFSVRFAGEIGKRTAMNSAILAWIIVSIVGAMITMGQSRQGFDLVVRQVCSIGSVIQLALVAAIGYSAGKEAPSSFSPSYTSSSGYSGGSGGGLIERLEGSSGNTSSSAPSGTVKTPNYCPRCGVSLKENPVQWTDTQTAICPVCNTVVSSR